MDKEDAGRHSSLLSPATRESMYGLRHSSSNHSIRPAQDRSAPRSIAASTKDRSRSSSSLLLDRPISVSDLLSTSRPASPLLLASTDVDGGVPRSSSPLSSSVLHGQGHIVVGITGHPESEGSGLRIHSPAGSVLSFQSGRLAAPPSRSASSDTSATTSLSTLGRPPAVPSNVGASKVLLPVDQRGVRTRLNILSPGLPNRASFHQQRESAIKPELAALPLADQAEIPSAEKKRRESNLSLLTQHVSGGESLAYQPHSSAPDMWPGRSSRRNVSESAVQLLDQTLGQRGPRLDSSHRSSSNGYRFPAATNSSATSSEVGHVRDRKNAGLSPDNAGQPVKGHNQRQPWRGMETTGGHAAHQSQSSIGSSTHHSPSLASTATFTTPASSKPSPRSAISSPASASLASTSRTVCNGARPHLPGAYDFSPTYSSSLSHGYTQSSLDTFETAPSANRSQRTYEAEDAQAGHASPLAQHHSSFSYNRDRSASVPRTVSDFDGSSGRVSESEDDGSLFSFAKMQAKVPANGSADELSVTLRKGQDLSVSRSSSTDDSQHADAFAAPQISPVPPKLDLDLGDFSSFSLDLDFDSDKVGFANRAMAEPGVAHQAEGPNIQSSLAEGDKIAFQRNTDDPAHSASAGAQVTTLSPLRRGDFSLGWGFPPVGPPRSALQDPSASLSSTHGGSQVSGPPVRLSAARLDPYQSQKGTDLDITPKASLSPSDDPVQPSSNAPASDHGRRVRPASSQSNLTLSDLESFRLPEFVNTYKTQHAHDNSIDGSSRSKERSESPASLSSSFWSRPASSLLPPFLDKTVNSDSTGADHDSRRTTLSSNDLLQGPSQVATAVDSSAFPSQSQSTSSQGNVLPQLASYLSTPSAFSFNKTLPPVPPDGRVDVSRGQVRSLALEPSGPVDVGKSPPSLDLLGTRSRGASNASSQDVPPRPASQRSFSDGTVPLASVPRPDAQPHLVAHASHTRSRSSTLERPHPVTEEHTRNLGGLQADARMQESTAIKKQDHTTKPAMQAPSTGVKAAATAKPTFPNGEIVRRDPATEKLLADVSVKLSNWLQRHPSRVVKAEPAPVELAAPASLEDTSVELKTTMLQSAVRVLQPAQKSLAKPVLLTTRIKEEPNIAQRTLSMLNKERSIQRVAETAQQPPIAESSQALEQARTKQSLDLTLQLEPIQPLRIHAKKPSGNSEVKQAGSATSSQRPPPIEAPFGEAWISMDKAVADFEDALASGKADRAQIIQLRFLAPFRQEELQVCRGAMRLGARHRAVLFRWVDAIFEDLKGTPANRGACLDGISAVIESRSMTHNALSSATDEGDLQRLRSTVAQVLAWAIEKLNGKAIFANTLGFAGKMLAAAFWLLDGVALKLLRLLPAVKRAHMHRVVQESGLRDCAADFPRHLDSLRFTGDLGSYVKLFPPVRASETTDSFLFSYTPSTATAIRGGDDGPQLRDNIEESDTIKVDMAGNWLIRWTATDSDLPFAFMRAYHRQLANYLPALSPGSTPLTAGQLIRAPGYLFMTAALLEVCDALIHRNLRSVTTMAPSNASVNANESANLAAGQKPKALEVVSKRVVQTIFEVVGGPLLAEETGASLEACHAATMRHNFGCSLRIWIAATTKRTSLWDTRGIFALLDLIEGLIYNVCATPLPESTGDDDADEDEWTPSEVGLALFDTSFILSFVKTILAKADNTTCLLRTISFLYTEFQSFTLRPADREELCEHIILDHEIFSRLFLSYNVGVRGYFLRLLVYRLARLGNPDDNRAVTVRDARIVRILRLFETRLEQVRRRHDELDPLPEDSDDEDDYFKPPRMNRSTILSTWGVHDKPWVMEGRNGRTSGGTSDDEAERQDRTPEESRIESSERDDTVKLTSGPHDPVASDEEDVTIQGVGYGSIAKLHRSGASLSPATSLDLTQSGDVSAARPGKKLDAAKKVAGGWWNTIKNRKGSGEGSSSSTGKRKEDMIALPYTHAVAHSGGSAPNSARSDNDKRVDCNDDSMDNRSSIVAAEHTGAHQPVSNSQDKARAPFPGTATATAQALGEMSSEGGANAVEPSLDLLAPPKKQSEYTDTPSPRSPAPPRRSISRKSIRRSPSNITSPRSRQSSMYSFDLDVDTPRSDAFDFPLSPASLGLSPVSPTSGGLAALSISPLAFNALMDGAPSFAQSNAGSASASASEDGERTAATTNSGSSSSGVVTSPLSHKRARSTASARRSRPVSVASGTGPSPRVSKRFSKRASILPPQALDLLRESSAEPVPQIPEQFRTPGAGAGAGAPYDVRLHPYAIKGLREYEDVLDEWELFVVRAREEEGAEGKELSALIPRLQCAWPSTWEE